MTEVSPGQKGQLWAPPHSVVYWESCLWLTCLMSFPRLRSFPLA